MRTIACALGVEKGQLRQREQAVVVARRTQPAMQLGEHRHRLLVEPIQEPESPENRFRGLRRLADRESALGLNAIGGLDVHGLHADRRRASRDDQREAGEPQNPQSNWRETSPLRGVLISMPCGSTAPR